MTQSCKLSDYSQFIVFIEFHEGHPLCLLLKSVAGENRIITVSVDKEEIQGALVSFGSYVL